MLVGYNLNNFIAFLLQECWFIHYKVRASINVLEIALKQRAEWPRAERHFEEDHSGKR
jgi:hypothetical protein